MVVSKTIGVQVNIIVDGQRVEQVTKFRYLGSLLAEDGRCLEDVKTRIGMAKDASNKRQELLVKNFSKDIKKLMIKTLVWPMAVPGCETWTMTKELINRLNAFEM